MDDDAEIYFIYRVRKTPEIVETKRLKVFDLTAS